MYAFTHEDTSTGNHRYMHTTRMYIHTTQGITYSCHPTPYSYFYEHTHITHMNTIHTPSIYSQIHMKTCNTFQTCSYVINPLHKLTQI